MRNIATISIFLLFCGCATVYQPQGLGGGFSETQLDTNIFTVTFKGNGLTSRERANDLTLLRSAELAVEHGFKYFVIVDSQQYSKNSTYTTPTTITTDVDTNSHASVYGQGNGTINPNAYGGIVYGYEDSTTVNTNAHSTATTTIKGGQTHNISKPRTTNTIVCFTDKPQGFAYDAEFLAKSLKGKYGIANTPRQ